MQDPAATSAVESGPDSGGLSLAGRLTVYVLLCGIGAALISPLARLDSGGWMEYGVYRFSIAAWSAQVLLLVAVLVLAVSSRIVAFQLALLVALVQGYVHAAIQALWYGDALDQQISFALIVGLNATLGAAIWLLVRIVWKRTLSAEAAENRGRSGQLGLGELLYVMASLSLVLACVSLFSFPGLMPAEQVLAATLGFALQTWPLVYAPFWLAVHRPLSNAHWLWLVPLTLLSATSTAWLEYGGLTWRPRSFELAAIVGIVLGSACVVAANALALRLLGLYWRRGVRAEIDRNVRG